MCYCGEIKHLFNLLIIYHSTTVDVTQRWPATYRLVGPPPEDGEEVDGADRGRQEAGDGLDVVEQLPEVLHDRDPQHRHHHHRQHAHPTAANTGDVSNYVNAF